MALDSPKLERIGCFAAKAETTTGVAIATLAADAAYVGINPTMTPDDSFNEVDLPADKGSRAGSAGAQSGTFTVDVELTGNGSAGLPSWASVLLPACDWEVSTATFSPVRGQTTLTIVLYEDGLKRTLSGSRGTFKIRFESGKPARVSFTFRGKYQSVADAAILAPTFPTVIAPIFAGATFTLGGATPRVSLFEFDAGNELVLREDAADVDGSGYHACEIVARKPMGTLDPEAVAVATKDWFGLYKAGTELALNLVIGSSANNTMTLAGAKFQIRKPDRGKRNKMLIDSLSGQFNGSTSATLLFA